MFHSVSLHRCQPPNPHEHFDTPPPHPPPQPSTKKKPPASSQRINRKPWHNPLLGRQRGFGWFRHPKWVSFFSHWGCDAFKEADAGLCGLSLFLSCTPNIHKHFHNFLCHLHRLDRPWWRTRVASWQWAEAEQRWGRMGREKRGRGVHL